MPLFVGIRVKQFLKNELIHYLNAAIEFLFMSRGNSRTDRLKYFIVNKKFFNIYFSTINYQKYFAYESHIGLDNHKK